MLKQLKIEIRIECCYLNDIDLGIANYLNKFLLKYSKKLEGIPVSYEILSTARNGPIVTNDPCVLLTCLVEIVVLCLNKGDLLRVKDGFVMGCLELYRFSESGFSGDVLFEEYKVENDRVFVVSKSI